MADSAAQDILAEIVSLVSLQDDLTLVLYTLNKQKDSVVVKNNKASAMHLQASLEKEVARLDKIILDTLNELLNLGTSIIGGTAEDD